MDNLMGIIPTSRKHTSLDPLQQVMCGISLTNTKNEARNAGYAFLVKAFEDVWPKRNETYPSTQSCEIKSPMQKVRKPTYKFPHLSFRLVLQTWLLTFPGY